MAPKCFYRLGEIHTKRLDNGSSRLVHTRREREQEMVSNGAEFLGQLRQKFRDSVGLVLGEEMS